MNCGWQGNDCGLSVVGSAIILESVIRVVKKFGIVAVKEKINLISFFVFNENDKNSRTISLFWNIQEIVMESEIIDKEAQFQWVCCLYEIYF